MNTERSKEWISPSEDCVKLNVDAALCSVAKEATLGVVARNSRAEIQFSAVTKDRDIESPLHAEMKAILFGLQVTRELEYSSIIVESDCMIAVQEIAKKQDSLCEWNSIILDIVELSVDFKFCVITHVNRLANTLAHNLIKSNCGVGDYRLWRFGLPPTLCNTGMAGN